MVHQQLTTLCIIAMTLSFGSVLVEGQYDETAVEPANPDHGCNIFCNLLLDPVCGVNRDQEFVTFSNPCMFEVTQCLNPDSDWHIAKTGQCDPKCSVICPYSNYPVCGVDKNGNMRNFENVCDLLHFAKCLQPLDEWKQFSVGQCNVKPVVPLPIIGKEEEVVEETEVEEYDE